MSAADSDQQATDEDLTSEQIAAALAARFVGQATAATVTWLQDCATAFESSLTRAVAGEYTASDLAKDAAAQWARNVTYAVRVFGVAGPSDDTRETTTDV